MCDCTDVDLDLSFDRFSSIDLVSLLLMSVNEVKPFFWSVLGNWMRDRFFVIDLVLSGFIGLNDYRLMISMKAFLASFREC